MIGIEIFLYDTDLMKRYFLSNRIMILIASLFVLYGTVSFVFWKYIKNRDLILGFEKVKDLVRGTIITGDIE